MERYVGIDLGIRTKHRVAVFDGPERRGKPFSVDVTPEGFEELMRRATEDVEGPVNFVVEPTGLAWLPVSAYVASEGHHVYLAKPQKASDLRKFLCKHTKSDTVDAGALARLPQIDPEGVHELQVPTAEETTLLRLVKRRERLTQQAADQKRRIESLLTMVQPGLLDALGEEKFGMATRTFLRCHADPQKVVQQGEARLRKFWAKHSNGQASQQQADLVFEACRKTAELYQPLRECGRLPFDYKEVQDELNAELDWMERAEQEAERVKSRMKELYRRLDPEETLKQLRGVGDVIAASLEAIIGNVNRFPNSCKFLGYTGMCSRKKQTGKSNQPMPITKSGHRLLKKYLYLAADVARQWDPDFAAYYARRYARGDHHNLIVVALARKMGLRVYALLKRREAARTAQREGRQAEPVRYVLRAPDGRELDKKEARALIKSNYVRSRLAPEQATRDDGLKSRRTRTEATETAKVEWPSMDATNGKSAPPSNILLPQTGCHAKPSLHTTAAPVHVGEAINAVIKEIQGQCGKRVESLLINPPKPRRKSVKKP